MEYTTVKETAEKWGVTVAFVYIAAKAGRISGAQQIDGKWCIPVDAENPSKRAITPEVGYISLEEAAEKWGVKESNVRTAAKAGRIPGAEIIGGRWHIPEDAENPSKSVPASKPVYIPKSAGKPTKKTTESKPGYISTAEASEKWGLTQGSVSYAAKGGRIPGAELIDGKWYIPEDAKNPSKRTTVPKLGYISTEEAAEKWSIFQTSVSYAAREGRIPGAKFIDGRWYIPENVEAPLNEKTSRLPRYVSVAKAAEMWDVSQRAVYKAAKDGDISGAKQIDGKWHIPEHAVCPIVGYGKRIL